MPEATSAARLQASARVVEALPGALFRLELMEGTRQQLTAHAAAESGLLRLLPGETVVVEISSRDAGRGRIVRKK